MRTQLFYVLVMCCEVGALKTLQRARDTEGATGWKSLKKQHEPRTAGRHPSLLLQVRSYNFTDDTSGSLDTLDLLVQKYESSTGPALGDALHSIQYVRIGLRRSPQHHAAQH